MKLLISIVVEQPCWQGASLHFRHRFASLTASCMVIRGMSRSQLLTLDEPWQWGVLSYCSEYASLTLVFLRVGLASWVGTGDIMSLWTLSENFDTHFLEEQPPPVPQDPNWDMLNSGRRRPDWPSYSEEVLTVAEIVVFLRELKIFLLNIWLIIIIV